MQVGDGAVERAAVRAQGEVHRSGAGGVCAGQSEITCVNYSLVYDGERHAHPQADTQVAKDTVE